MNERSQQFRWSHAILFPSVNLFLIPPFTNGTGNNSYSCIRYSDVINFNRCSKSHNCVMCGLKGNIPSQNKDVCKSCDTVFWYHRKLDVVIKFCKGAHSEYIVDRYDIWQQLTITNYFSCSYLQDARILSLSLNSRRNLRPPSVGSAAIEGDRITLLAKMLVLKISSLHRTQLQKTILMMRP